jgi:hypothetical protein
VPIDRRALALAALLVGLIFAAYAPALRGGFTWDDDAHIYENKTLDDLSGLRAIWLTPGSTMQYYPLTFTCFWIGRHLWGLDPLGYHLLNVAMHAAAALLLWRLLLRLRVPGAFAGACLFALHPVNVMTVAWVTELKNTLAATLALASGLAYLRFAGEPARGSGTRRRSCCSRWRCWRRPPWDSSPSRWGWSRGGDGTASRGATSFRWRRSRSSSPAWER